jgi:hypothetical protein
VRKKGMHVAAAESKIIARPGVAGADPGDLGSGVIRLEILREEMEVMRRGANIQGIGHGL